MIAEINFWQYYCSTFNTIIKIKDYETDSEQNSKAFWSINLSIYVGNAS